MIAAARCPRCKEPFETGERFCKHCGIRKGTSPKELQWFFVGVIFDLLIVGLLTGIQHTFAPFKGMAMGLADAFSCFGPLLNVALLLLPLFYLSFTYQHVLLRKRGVTTKGKVVGNETQMVGRHGDVPRFVSVIEFEAELDPLIGCRIEYSSFMKRKGWLPIGSEVDVVYDPYNPRRNARVGGRVSLGRFVWRIAFCIILICIFGGLVFLLTFF